MYTMPKRTERVLHFLAFLVQGSSYLDPRAYAILHREHNAYSDTARDPHTPWLHSNAATMMWKTKKRYSDYAHRRVAPEPRFDGDVPEWPWLERFADAWPTRIAFGAAYSLFYLAFATHWWQIAFRLPFHFVLGPVPGASVIRAARCSGCSGPRASSPSARPSARRSRSRSARLRDKTAA